MGGKLGDLVAETLERCVVVDIGGHRAISLLRIYTVVLRGLCGRQDARSCAGREIFDGAGDLLREGV